LPQYVRKGSYNRQRPGLKHSIPPAHQVNEHPRRQQREDGHHVANRSGQSEQRQSGNQGEAQDRRPQSAVRNGSVVGESGDADGVKVRNSQSNQNGHHYRPREAKSHQTFEKRAECPRQHDGLNPNVGRGVMNHPAFESFEMTRQHQGIENDEAPESDPVDDPKAGEAAVQVGFKCPRQRSVPDVNANRDGNRAHND